MSSAKITPRDLTKRRIPCEHGDCKGTAQIHGYRKTSYTDLGNGPGSDRSILEVKYGVYFCPTCGNYFTQKISDGNYGRGHSRYTKRVHDKVIRLVLEDGQSQLDTVLHMYKQHGASIPLTTLSDWVRKEKARRESDGE